MKYDIFISYRRDGGEYTAKIIYDRLLQLGYHVFFDVETLRSGHFNTKLFTVIDNCKDFLLVLSPNSLDRCINEDDWVRLEIEYALKQSKNIIPILLRGFHFPEILPADIDEVRNCNGLEASTEFFDAFINKSLEFLISKPDIMKRLRRKLSLPKVIVGIIALIILCSLFFKLYAVDKSLQTTLYSNDDTPTISIEDKEVVNILSYFSTNLAYYNQVLDEYDEIRTATKSYCDDPSDMNYNFFKYALLSNKSNMIKLNEKYIPLTAKLDNSNLPKDDINALKDYLSSSTNSMLSDIDTIEFMSLQDLSMLTKLLDYYEQFTSINNNIVFYGLNDIFIHFDEDIIMDFKYLVLPTLTNIFQGQKWYTDADEITEIVDTNYDQYNLILSNYSELVGECNLQSGSIETSADELENIDAELDALRAEAKEKFRPLVSDDLDILWGKMLRFNTLKMYDMSIECLTMYQEKDKTWEADIFIPIAIEYFRQISNTGIDYGCLVCGYEQDKPQNTFYHIGDILIELNGNQIKTYEDIVASKIADQSSKVKVLRYNGTNFEVVEGEIPVGDSMVAFYDMCEIIE